MVPKTYSDQRFQVLAVFLNANFHGLASQEFIVDSIPALASSFGRFNPFCTIHLWLAPMDLPDKLTLGCRFLGGILKH